MDAIVKAWADRLESLKPGEPGHADRLDALMDRLEATVCRRGDLILILDDIAGRLQRRGRPGHDALVACIRNRQGRCATRGTAVVDGA
jgi:hypothetical protein